MHKKNYHENVSLQQCVDAFAVRANVAKFNQRAEKALKGSLKQAKVVDCYSITAGDECKHTGNGDGWHYMSLAPDQLAELMKQLGATGSTDADYIQEAACNKTAL